MQPIATVAPTRERNDAVGPVLAAIGLDQLEQLFLGLRLVALLVVVAIVADAFIVEANVGHRLGQNAPGAALDFRLRVDQQRLFGSVIDQVRDQVLGA